jgi:D-glycero-D-manno-heptose 1,7-bisphosphate phosphatase
VSGPAAAFLDRDGVLIADTDLITKPQDIRVLAGVPEALLRLHAAGYRLVVISNQAVVARGLLSEEEVAELQAEVGRRLLEAGAPVLDGFFFCPHHPNATLMAYRVACDCRKPRPGLLLRASRELDIDLAGSFMIGDRLTDVIAGERAGCKTILVETGANADAAIETVEPVDLTIEPDYRCHSLADAVRWIERTR